VKKGLTHLSSFIERLLKGGSHDLEKGNREERRGENPDLRRGVHQHRIFDPVLS